MGGMTMNTLQELIPNEASYIFLLLGKENWILLFNKGALAYLQTYFKASTAALTYKVFFLHAQELQGSSLAVDKWLHPSHMGLSTEILE